MRYLALATDYDGTLTSTGTVAPETVTALDRLRISGRKSVLVTGRRLDELLEVCACIDSFDCVVAENGALLYQPATRETTLLAEPVSGELVEALRRRGVDPLEVGKAIISTREPHESKVLDEIRKAGLEHQVIFNRGAVMILPAGVNKATGLHRALSDLGLSPHEVVGIGDAENDYSFLTLSECAVAVSNAIDSIKSAADLVMRGAAGDGVVELIDLLIETDLANAVCRKTNLLIPLGNKLDGTTVWVPPYGRNILIAGPSGSGKSHLAGGFVERLLAQFYQVCIIDPEGDYVSLPFVVTVGDEYRAPSIDEALRVLRVPGVNININLLGVRLSERPAFFAQLFPHLQAMRARTGRPHWFVIDEAHHLLPVPSGSAPADLPQKLGETILVTVHPDHIAPSILPMVDVVVAVGASPDRTFRQFTAAAGQAPLRPLRGEEGENMVACWFTKDENDPFPMRVIHARVERIRHHRKYALGELGHRSFYFRGPNEQLNLKAQNLAMFCQIAEGVDDNTWKFHLNRGDYSRWFSAVIKDEEIAKVARDLERREDVSAADSRLLICDAINARYSLPA